LIFESMALTLLFFVFAPSRSSTAGGATASDDGDGEKQQRRTLGGVPEHEGGHRLRGEFPGATRGLIDKAIYAQKESKYASWEHIFLSVYDGLRLSHDGCGQFAPMCSKVSQILIDSWNF
jgi:hypothetical protein